MEAMQPHSGSLAMSRHFYAEEIRAVANISSPTLVAAFSKVEREKFLGPPPWLFAGEAFLKKSAYTTTSDARDLYHNVVVALKSGLGLNNGQPSIVASCLLALDVGPGDRVLHVGCGTGYYTAILAELAGSAGDVLGVEVDAELAARAQLNLRRYANVQVVHGDGAAIEPGCRDAILVSAGVTQPHLRWLSSLTEGSSLVLPLTVAAADGRHGRGVIVKIVRKGTAFVAEVLSMVAIYTSASTRDQLMEVQLKQSFASGDLLKLRSVRVDPHEQSNGCIAHSTSVCLSSVATDGLTPGMNI
jgi:protein-L-isoaspartate(D-aspartate) O-methyltransferase